MKKLFSLLLVIALLLCPAFAVGDGNIDGGEGDGLGDGTVQDQWIPGDDGVRVSIMNGTTTVKTFDLSNKDWSGIVQYHFGGKNKLSYLRHFSIAFSQSDYENNIVSGVLELPKIIMGNGTSNIDKIRDYFTFEDTIRYIADQGSIPYDELISGDYKLLIEPIAYLRFKGVWFAMTATEAAIYNTELGKELGEFNPLHSKLGSLTRMNLPLSMFLKQKDLGIDVPQAGETTGRQSDLSIYYRLGVGIVTFSSPPQPPEDEYGEYTYHTDIDVITSVMVSNTLGRDMTPDSGDFVTFEINGTTTSKQIVCPAGENQLVWIKWHTPSQAREMTVTITEPSGKKTHLTVSVVELTENTPPDAEYDGPGTPGGDPGITHNQYRPNFTPLKAPSWGNHTHATWDVWVAELKSYWEENWVWVVTKPAVKDDKGNIITAEEGSWDDQGEWVEYWDFSIATYHANLWTDYELVPNEKVPTAELRQGKWLMGSGYGVDANVEVRSSGNAGDSSVTPVQGVYAVFPEFDYTEYFRLLEPERSGWYHTTWRFAVNPYSYYEERVHFTPVWFPDGKYEVAVAVFDVWTPAGMLYASLSDYVNIKGTMFDDWYIRSY